MVPVYLYGMEKADLWPTVTLNALKEGLAGLISVI